MGNYYPPLGFHFTVVLDISDKEFQFQSVSGLSAELETEEIAEGGENRFKHTLPVRAKYQNLVLKRGLVVKSGLINWCRDAIENFIIKPTNITISLLNEENQPLASWKVINAYPVKWDISDFNAEENKIVIETLELTYSYFTTVKIS